MRTIGCGKSRRYFGCDCSGCGCDELCPADRAGGASVHTTEYFEWEALRFWYTFADGGIGA